MLESKGLGVDVLNDFPANCTQVPNLPQPYLLVRYVGGHTGIPDADAITDNLLNGDVCGSLPIWQRLLTMIAYMDSSFPNGFNGPGDLSIGDPDPRGDIMKTTNHRTVVGHGRAARQRASRCSSIGHRLFSTRPVASRSCTSSAATASRRTTIAQLADLLDPLILANQIQNMFVAVLPGAGGRKASFYVNHRVPESQVPDLLNPTSGRYEDSIIQDLIPAIENTILQGRVRQ